jgi:hypothetical protein
MLDISQKMCNRKNERGVEEVASSRKRARETEKANIRGHCKKFSTAGGLLTKERT